ncbi:SdrD B-like domain-containing protein [Methylomonas sp. AM2-LC]|uniref:SdrD B-like domain-containing protein n=1 Tax=Methylomonas sp. AM2-LC TaxID=3153301 RepID=UPI003264B5F6
MSINTLGTLAADVTSTIYGNTETQYAGGPVLDPSFLYITISNSNVPQLANGYTYGTFCLNINLTTYYGNSSVHSIYTNATAYAGYTGNDTDTYQAASALGESAPAVQIPLTETQIQEINWIVEHNFNTDSQYASANNGAGYTFGEIQAAIWEIEGLTPAEYTSAAELDLLTNNNPSAFLQSAADAIAGFAKTAIAAGAASELLTNANATIVLQPGTANSAISLPAGTISQPLLVEVGSGKIDGTVWQDTLCTGSAPTGTAPLLNGVTVELMDSTGTKVIATTVTSNDPVTGAAGYYEFTGLNAGNYTVKFITPANYYYSDDNSGKPGSATTLSDDANSTTGLSSVISVAQGQSVSYVDAGLVHASILNGTVFLDSNGNGVKDTGDIGAKGITVDLLDSTGKTILDHTVTDANGKYSFTEAPGTYIIEVIAPKGDDFTQPTTAGASGSIVSQVDDNGYSTTITTCGTTTTTNAGITPCTVNLGGEIWNDTNGNGLINAPCEKGMSGIQVTLVGTGASAGFTPITVTTDSTGHYKFANVAWGTYIVEMNVPKGESLTLANVGGSANADNNSEFTYQTILGTTNLISNGSFETGNLSGWSDPSGHAHVVTASSQGLTGATGADVLELQGVGQFSCWSSWFGGSACSSDYVTQNVATTAGQTYQLSFDAAENYCSTHAAAASIEVLWGGNVIGTINPTSSTFHTYTFNVTAGSGTSSTLEFLEQGTATTGGAFCCSSQNTNSSAFIDNVHLVSVNTLAETGTITVNSCNDNLNINGGLTNCHVKGNVWVDNCHTGVYDSGHDTNYCGETVKLEKCINNVYQVVATTTSDCHGNYDFGNLDCGKYEVVSQCASGYGFTTQNACQTPTAITSCVDTTGCSHEIDLCASQQYYTANIGVCHTSYCW